MARQEATVLANNWKVVCAQLSRALLIRSKAPIASIIPPKTIAQIISQIVPSIPSIPPEVNKSLSNALEVVISVETEIASMIAL